MMLDATELIAGFYEAALEGTLWPDRMRQLAAFGQAIGAGFLLWDRQAEAPALLVTSGHMSVEATEAFKQAYARLDPLRPMMALRPLGQWTTSADLFNDDFVATDRFLAEHLARQGIQHVAAARLVEREHVDLLLFLHRGPEQTAFSKDEFDRLERVGRCLAGALGLYVDLLQTRPAHVTAMTLLERAGPPAALVDGEGRVLFATPTAKALSEWDDAIGLGHDRVTARRSLDACRLRELIARAARVDHATPGQMLIDRPPDRPPLALFVTPSKPITTLDSLTPVATALVLVCDAEHRFTSLPPWLRSLFGLSVAEAALVQGLIQGKRLSEIAACREVSSETVRTQLRSVFRKTGVSRQTDLVRMMQLMFQPTSGHAAKDLE